MNGGWCRIIEYMEPKIPKKVKKVKKPQLGIVRKVDPKFRDPKTGHFLPGNDSGNEFPKGVPGPGRKPGPNLSTTLRKAMDSPSVDVPGKSNAEVIIDMAIARASHGDFKFFEYMFDRMDGKMAQTVLQNVSMLQGLSDQELRKIANGTGLPAPK